MEWDLTALIKIEHKRFWSRSFSLFSLFAQLRKFRFVLYSDECELYIFPRSECVTTYRLNANGRKRFIIIHTYFCVSKSTWYVQIRSPMWMERSLFLFLSFFLLIVLRANGSHSHYLTLAQLRCCNLGIWSHTRMWMGRRSEKQSRKIWSRRWGLSFRKKCSFSITSLAFFFIVHWFKCTIIIWLEKSISLKPGPSHRTGIFFISDFCTFLL